MGKKNTNFTLGLNREQLKNKAMELGKTRKQVSKANTKALENFIKSKENPTPKGKRTRKPYDTDFRFGIDRTQLKRLASDLGYKGNVGKANTKALENYIQNQLVGKGKKVELTEPMKRDIKGFFDIGYSKGKGYLAEKLARVTGSNYDSDGALAIEIEKQFSVFYDGVITKDMVDELMFVRMQYQYVGQAFNGLKNTFEYMDTFREYARELTEEEGREYDM